MTTPTRFTATHDARGNLTALAANSFAHDLALWIHAGRRRRRLDQAAGERRPDG